MANLDVGAIKIIKPRGERARSAKVDVSDQSYGCSLCETPDLQNKTPFLGEKYKGRWILMFKQFVKPARRERTGIQVSMTHDGFQLLAFNLCTGEWLPFKSFISHSRRQQQLWSLLGNNFEKTIPYSNSDMEKPMNDMVMAVEGKFVVFAVHDGDWKKRSLLIFNFVEDGPIKTAPFPAAIGYKSLIHSISILTAPSSSTLSCELSFYVYVTFTGHDFYMTMILDVDLL